MVGTSQLPLNIMAVRPAVNSATAAGYAVFLVTRPLLVQSAMVCSAALPLVSRSPRYSLPSLYMVPPDCRNRLYHMRHRVAGSLLVLNAAGVTPALSLMVCSALVMSATEFMPVGLPSAPSRPAFFSRSLL